MVLEALEDRNAREQFATKMATKFRQFPEVSEDVEMEWWLFRIAMILLPIESYGPKRLRMAAVGEKEYLDGIKMLKKLSEPRKMLLKHCWKTGHHLICNPGIRKREKLQLWQ